MPLQNVPLLPKNYFQLQKPPLCLKAEPPKEITCHEAGGNSYPFLGTEVGTIPRQTLSQTFMSPIYSPKGAFIFPKSCLFLSALSLAFPLLS